MLQNAEPVRHVQHCRLCTELQCCACKYWRTSHRLRYKRRIKTWTEIVSDMARICRCGFYRKFNDNFWCRVCTPKATLKNVSSITLLPHWWRENQHHHVILTRTILVFREFRFTPKSKFCLYWHPHIHELSTWERTTVASEKWEKALKSAKIQMVWPWAWCDINDLTAIPSTSAQSVYVAGWNEYNSCSQETIISASHHSWWVVKWICISFLLQYIHDLIGGTRQGCY